MPIDKKLIFCSVSDNFPPPDSSTVRNFIKSLDTESYRVYTNPKPSQDALNNAHGDWYEWLLSIIGWNISIDEDLDLLPLKLPNISQFDCSELYRQDLFDLIADLRQKVEISADVNLITSNPDFVLINKTVATRNSISLSRIRTLDENALTDIDTQYQQFIGKCGLDDIEGYMAAKLSLRPDRRLQIPHEGSLMKAIYVHLQTRKWIMEPRGIKYYAITGEAGDADFNALKTVATHSITTVNEKPQRAVDKLFVSLTIQDIMNTFSEILTF